ncbi:hypothetical protein AM1BK_45370 [Neobacillus kokaensis]|uniref:Uncharacterized protein n=1 Tax=Neobacillus kokaensis TaxID=2759023 RepID=A0ABQ3N7S2_9BACI|nr:hypothetical protein AM1BK_45370 [Neobacillus kokaensis]
MLNGEEKKDHNEKGSSAFLFVIITTYPYKGGNNHGTSKYNRVLFIKVRG